MWGGAGGGIQVNVRKNGLRKGDARKSSSGALEKASIKSLRWMSCSGGSQGHNIRALLLLCFSLLGFFFPKNFIFLTCGQFARLKKDASLSGFYSFRGQ
jgi:hypothetical protein